MNEVAYADPPVRSEAGETDKVLDEGMELMHEVIDQAPWPINGSCRRYRAADCRHREYLGKFLNQLWSATTTCRPLRKCRDRFDMHRGRPHCA
jgi:hypothetical protein